MNELVSYLPWAAVVLYALGALFPKQALPAGFLLQALYMGIRGFTIGRLPIVGLHDTLGFFASCVAGFSVVYIGAAGQRRWFYPLVGLSASLLAFFSALAKPHAGPLPPVLQTYWFEFHVILSFCSYALFGLAALLGALYLSRPEPALERAQYRSILIAFCLFSLSMIFGGIWAYLAWGTYWLWTPKELWTTILWVYYSLYLHVRLIRGLSGRTAVIAGVFGFLVVMFTYAGVGLLMKSSHSF